MHNLFFFLIIFILFDTKADSLYEPLGDYLGKIEDNGSMYDSMGSYKGIVESNGGI